MAIYGVDGKYGIGKTAFSVYYAKKFKEQYGSKGIVISNIKLYGGIFKDYVHFDDNNILKVLRTINYINDQERNNPKNYIYNKKTKKISYKRGVLTKFLIIFDESGSLLNKHQKKIYETALLQYINQTRKINYDLIMTSVKGDENFKQLRDKVEIWYSMEQNFDSIPLLRDIRTVYSEIRESDGVTLKTEKFIGKDLKGDRILKERPLRKKYDWFYKPGTYDYYDDLYKNIYDEYEHKEILDFLEKF